MQYPKVPEEVRRLTLDFAKAAVVVIQQAMITDGSVEAMQASNILCNAIAEAIPDSATEESQTPDKAA